MIKNHIERDIAAELTDNPPVTELIYHASLDSTQNKLPSVLIVADSKPLIETNHTHDISLQIILSTQSDDTEDTLAIDYAEQLTDYLDSPEFLTAITARASRWQPIHLEQTASDATDTEDRRFIQRTQFRLIAQS